MLVRVAQPRREKNRTKKSSNQLSRSLIFLPFRHGRDGGITNMKDHKSLIQSLSFDGKNLRQNLRPDYYW